MEKKLTNPIVVCVLALFCCALWGRVAIYSFSVPVFGVVMSGIFLKEQFLSWKNLAALVLVCGGILIVNSKGRD